MMKINVNSVYLFTFACLICLPCFIVPIGSKLLLVASVLTVLSFILSIIINKEIFLFYIKKFFINKYTRLFIYFILWTIFASIILLMCGKTTFSIALSHIFFGLIYSVAFPLFFGFYMAKKIPIDKIIKVLYVSLYIIVVIGLIDFLIFFFNIDILKHIYQFFVNIQTIRDSIAPRDIQFMGLPRVHSIFYEPGVYSYFLALILPFVYYCCNNIKDFSNYTYINQFVKKTFPLLTWFNIICTFSPIGIIMSIITTTLYQISISKNLKILLKKIILLSLIILLIFICLDKDNEIISKILQRILSVSYIFTNFQQFTNIEGSLATRIVYYINCTIIGFKNIILGVGWGHLGLSLKNQLLYSPVPLTSENISTYFIKESDTTSYVLSIAYAIFGATGLLGFVLFYSFIFRLLQKLKQLRTVRIKYSNLFFLYLVLFVIYSFYESPMYYQYYWLLIGIIASYLNNYKFITVNEEGKCR